MRISVKIGNLWFERYVSRDNDFVNYMGGRVLQWKDIAKSTVTAIREGGITRKY